MFLETLAKILMSEVDEFSSEMKSISGKDHLHDRVQKLIDYQVKMREISRQMNHPPVHKTAEPKISEDNKDRTIRIYVSSNKDLHMDTSNVVINKLDDNYNVILLQKNKNKSSSRGLSSERSQSPSKKLELSQKIAETFFNNVEVSMKKSISKNQPSQ